MSLVRRTYRYRIYPSRSQVTRLNETLRLCCELYNAGLQERRDAYRLERKTVRYFEQSDQLPDVKRERPEFKGVHSQVLQDVLRRLDKAYEAFFRRLLAGEKAGLPRFRSARRYDSFTQPQPRFALKGGRLSLSKIGWVKIRLHRPLGGRVKALTVSRSPTGKWFAHFSVELAARPSTAGAESVGVDCGLEKFATLSTGEAVENPRFLRADATALAKAQRGNKRRAEARIHERVADRRRDFAHQLSRRLVARFGLIVFEDLPVEDMLKNRRLARAIHDASWRQLIRLTAYKAEGSGGVVVKVNPYNTSRRCSACGRVEAKELSQRLHDCPCGLRIDRDWNAALNILSLGLQAAAATRREAAPGRAAE